MPSDPLHALVSLFQAHPWHGVSPGECAPDRVTCYIEIVPSDTVKYELDKRTGLLRVDRPQRYSNVVPCLYGFVPRTYCMEDVGARCAERTGQAGLVGDGDPLDVCVLSERAIPHGNILVEAVPIGGLRMVDGNEADDKIVAVMRDDGVYGHLTQLAECPQALVERLRHYFLTYKQSPDRAQVPSRGPVELAELYDRDEAHEVIRRAQADYRRHHGALLDAAAALGRAEGAALLR